MRKSLIAVGTSVLLAGLVGLAKAQTKPETPTEKTPPGETKDMGTCEGAIIRLYKDEKVIELKVEKIVEPDMARKAEEMVKMHGLRVGEVIFLHVADSRVLDERGVELKRDDKSAWFTKDAGWASLKEGKRIKTEYTGTYEMPPPRDFPREARTGGNILVYHAALVQILPEEHKG